MQNNLRQLLKLLFDIQVLGLVLFFFLFGLFLGRFIWFGAPSILPADQTVVEVTPTPTVLSLGEIEQQKAEGKELELPVTYVVQPGDSSWRIAGVFYDNPLLYPEIEKANNLTVDQDLEVGQELTIPKLAEKPLTVEEALQTDPDAAIDAIEEDPYVVQINDSLWFIALKYLNDGERWDEIYQQNRPVIGDNPHLIYPGQTLVLPAE